MSLDELVELVTPEEDEVIQARILLIARETSWESIQDDIDTSKLDMFRLQEFSKKRGGYISDAVLRSLPKGI